MHHLILVRECDQQMSGSGCCGRIEGDAIFWDDHGNIFGDRREKMNQVGEIYRAIRTTYGAEVEITVLDPRNVVSFVPMVLRDAVRHRVPLLTTLKALGSTSLSSAVLDGQVLYFGRIPDPQEVVDLIAARLEVHRVGMAPAAHA